MQIYGSSRQRVGFVDVAHTNESTVHFNPLPLRFAIFSFALPRAHANKTPPETHPKKDEFFSYH